VRAPLLAVLLAGCFVPAQDQVAFPEPAVVVPAITGVDGDGSADPVAGELPDGGVPADHRLAEALVISGTALDLATEAQLRHPEPEPAPPCLDGPGADPCVLHDARTGLLLLPGSALQRTVALPPTMAAGAYLLALLAPSGEAHAQVFVLQGESGVHCWDRDEDRACDDAEDVNGDGDCTSADCVPAELQCNGPDCVLNRNLLVAGELAATESVTGDSVIAGERDLGAAVQALEAADAALDARIAAIEADYATATALADLDARVSVVELDYATATDLAALDSRVAGIEADVATATDLAALDSRVAGIEADYATATDLAALDVDVAALDADLATLAANTPTEIKVDTIWTIPGTFATVEEAVDAYRDTRIAPGVFLTLEIIGTHALSTNLDLQHPDAHRLRLVGGSLTAGSDVLEFSGTNGVYIPRSTVRFVNNLVIRGDDTPSTSGILVTDSGSLLVGEDVLVEGFPLGVRAVTNSLIFAPNIEVTGGTNACVVAAQGGVVNVGGSFLDDCGVGVQASSGSTIIAPSVTVASASLHAFLAQGNSSIDATGSDGTSESHCAFAHMSGSIRANDLVCVVDSPTNDSIGSAAFAQHDAMVLVAGTGLLEAEQGPVLSATIDSMIVAWGGRTLRGNGTQIAVASSGAVVRASDATLDGAYSYGVLVSQGSYARWLNVVDNGAANVVEAGSTLHE
jgi:hypothetical protein